MCSIPRRGFTYLKCCSVTIDDTPRLVPLLSARPFYNGKFFAGRIFFIKTFARITLYIGSSIHKPFDSKTIGVQYPSMFFVNFTCFLRPASPFSALKSFLVYAVSASTPETHTPMAKNCYYNVIT